jgi:hypothetical protein
MPSSRRTGDSSVDLSLGGASPAYAVTIEGVLGARALPDAIPTAIEDRLSRLPVSSFLWSIFTA